VRECRPQLAGWSRMFDKHALYLFRRAFVE